MARSRRHILGSSKEDLVERFEAIVTEIVPTNLDRLQLFRTAFRAIARALIELGIPYPLSYIIPQPFRINFCREDFVHVVVSVPEAVDGGGVISSSISPTDYTFRARDNGILVLDYIRIKPQDEFSVENSLVQFFFGPRENRPIFQADASVTERGFWQFDRVILGGQKSELTIRITDISLPASGVHIAIEVCGWEL